MVRYASVRYGTLGYGTLGYGTVEISDKYGLPTVQPIQFLGIGKLTEYQCKVIKVKSDFSVFFSIESSNP